MIFKPRAIIIQMRLNFSDSLSLLIFLYCYCLKNSYQQQKSEITFVLLKEMLFFPGLAYVDNQNIWMLTIFFLPRNNCNWTESICFVSVEQQFSLYFCWSLLRSSCARCQWTITSACFLDLNKMNVIYFDSGVCVVSISHWRYLNFRICVAHNVKKLYADFKTPFSFGSFFFLETKRNETWLLARDTSKKPTTMARIKRSNIHIY